MSYLFPFSYLFVELELPCLHFYVFMFGCKSYFRSVRCKMVDKRGETDVKRQSVADVLLNDEIQRIVLN